MFIVKPTVQCIDDLAVILTKQIRSVLAAAVEFQAYSFDMCVNQLST